MNKTILEVSNVTKNVSSPEGELTIVNDISLSLEEGVFASILGPSGSGKTTLLAIMAGLDLPSRGSVKLFDKEITNLNEDKRAQIRSKDVGFVFQSFHLLPRLSALDNVMMPLEILGAKDAKERALKALDEVGLSKRTGHVPHQLSGGEKQRVAIARAMVKNPSILFADEPTGNLDQSSTDNILELLLGINQQTKTTLVVVTHDHSLAERSDVVFELQEGKLKC
ncbi:MAG: ABC transporter ATP-binding protein [Gammaproteobacteria bacterium]|jgi:putative ABC transport system ATP-binding protein|nr:ABC transporter ATP-binding protein [Gammaproteobacteria bacterium]HJN01246.1 ABC transporter ATP-binding protein [Gammaproteobacteria bacterium]|tara:strand:- start:12377 stop:13048 length:672 start_codon:yes stop_codon:yes gene_type:complete